MARPSEARPRILFLDDDAGRARAFRAEHPDAAWVQTAEQCLAALAEPWDEIHLDHDLGGERLVDHERDDCGMEIVRWLCHEPRPHLQAARFSIHTLNPNAASMMALHLQVTGYQVEVRPFRTDAGGQDLTGSPRRARGPLAGRVIDWWRRLGGN